jgi:hypothetical protein
VAAWTKRAKKNPAPRSDDVTGAERAFVHAGGFVVAELPVLGDLPGAGDLVVVSGGFRRVAARRYDAAARTAHLDLEETAG